MYENPNQDLGKLWRELRVKYFNRSGQADVNNQWATVPHYLTHPCYIQNYFRAAIIKAQIYNYLTSNLGELTKNSKTAEILQNNLFQYGKSLSVEELVI